MANESLEAYGTCISGNGFEYNLGLGLHADDDSTDDEDAGISSRHHRANTTNNRPWNDLLRPRTSELHHYALAMDIINDLEAPFQRVWRRHDVDTNDLEDDQGLDDDSVHKGDDVKAHSLNSLSDGLKVLTRPRKSEKHIFFIADYLLDDDDDDE